MEVSIHHHLTVMVTAIVRIWKWMLVVSWLLMASFLLSLPLLSRHLNAKVGDDSSEAWEIGGLCTLSPSVVHCTNGVNLTEALHAWNRTMACGCGEGVFGEGVCPLGEGAYSISQFIATGPGTGLMATFALIPVASMWAYMAHLNKALPTTIWSVQAAGIFLALFQLNFMLFLVFSTCVFPNAHSFVVLIFNAAAAIHFLLLGHAAGTLNAAENISVSHRTDSRIMLCGVVLCILSIVGGSTSRVLYEQGTITWPYGFWLGECCGLITGMGLAPILFLVDFFRSLASTGKSETVVQVPNLELKQVASAPPEQNTGRSDAPSTARTEVQEKQPLLK